MAKLFRFPRPLSVKEKKKEEQIEKWALEAMAEPTPSPYCSEYKFKIVTFDAEGSEEWTKFRDLGETKEYYDSMCDVAFLCELRMPIWIELD